MREFIAMLALAAVALLATHRSVYRFRRSRLASVALAGGWLPLAVGVVFGPAVWGILEDSTSRSAVPLLIVAMGWIGFAIGLQLRREILRLLPRAIVRLTAVDFAASVVLFGLAAWMAVGAWTGDRFSATIIAPVSILIAVSIGWSLETRSLGMGDEVSALATAGALRGAGSLAMVGALGVAGLGGRPMVAGDRWPHALLAIIITIGVALVIAIIGRYALNLAAEKRDHQLVVFFGLIALVAGAAAEALVSPMFAAMVTAAALTNMRGKPLRWFERFIFKGEPLIAAIVAFMAGVLLDPVVPPAALLLVGLLVAARAAAKPAVLATGAGRADARRLFAAVRPGPLALALGVGLVIESPTPLSRQLLTVIVLTSLASEVIALLVIRPRAAAPADQSPVPEGAA